MGIPFASDRSVPVRRYLIDLTLLTVLSVAGLFAAVLIGLSPRDPAKGVAVVFAPWTGADAALSRSVEAKARFVRYGGASFVAVVIPDDADYPERVRTAGAWMVLDPQALDACLSLLGTQKT